MDIAKYVGLFLLKNEYCFMPGIGSLEIEKRPAIYDKESQKMSAPVFEVKYRQAAGSIDDSFANFIANNERISIAHASNHLKDFCARTKIELREGAEVVIPGIGKFSGGANDAIHFVTDAHLHIEGKAIPFFKNSIAVTERKEEALSNIIERTTIREPKADEEIEYKAPSVNWGKIILMIALVVILVGGGIFLFWYMGRDKQPAPPQQATPEQATQQTPPVTTAPVSQQDTAATTPAVTAPAGTTAYKVALQQYATRAQAESRVAKLKSYGNAVELYAKDSSTYYVVMQINAGAADTTRAVDSLRRMFNPGGKVSIVN